MAKNITYEPGYKLSLVVTDPAIPESGDAVRVGALTGIALTKEGEGGNEATKTTVDFGPFVADFEVLDEATGGIAVGDAIFYDDGIHGLNNDAVNGYFFGTALAAVQDGKTATIPVLHTPSPGAGTLADNSITAGKIAANAVTTAKILNANVTADKLAADAVETAKILNANITEAKIKAADLTGTVAKVVANANVIGGLPVLFRIDCADASANVDVVSTHKIRVIDAWGLNTGIAAHAANDTWQVKNGADAISDAVAKTATVNAVKRISTIDPAKAEIAAGGTLRITTVKDTNAAVTVYVLAIRVA